MKKLFLSFAVAVCVCACDNAPDVPQNPTYACGDYTVEMSFTEEGNTMHAIINGDAVDLALVESASGAKYSGVLNDTAVTLWGKGLEYTLFLGEPEIMIECLIK